MSHFRKVIYLFQFLGRYESIAILIKHSESLSDLIVVVLVNLPHEHLKELLKVDLTIA